ncbi:hypothetical protein GCM10011507_04590 [Edaphobacter acidisoli]|uniref:Flagellar FliJ protein n=1 Tax=Edaphobacter acidisoli TaxID=2040573 RepID=A0A916RGL5_9BACT|nr:hypothetical protein [Edaphobacter acidisoli]GGA56347.1 hypothetical protein GCM10011507_04590 [Edaphobacter acidisoli]
MQARIETLKRLTKLYEAVEKAHSVELKRTTAALHEVQSAVDAEAKITRRAAHQGREALASGDRMQWAAADLQRKAAGAKRNRLESVRVERKRSSETAREQYVASRRKSEQMQRLTTRAAEQIAVDEAKKMQSATDDRFLARRRWSGAAGEQASTKRMKAS